MGHLRACSHVGHQMQTQRGVELCKIILEGSNFIICFTHLFYTSFIKCGSRDHNQYLIIHKALQLKLRFHLVRL